MADQTVRSAELREVDPVWSRLKQEAQAVIRREPEMAPLIYASILNRTDFVDALTYRLAHRLASGDMPDAALRDMFRRLHQAHPELTAAARADVMAVLERDPACHDLLQPMLYNKGFHAVQAHRASHLVWKEGRKTLSYFLQMRNSELFSVDIHPNARIGQGIMIDHAHSIVIGETAVVGDNVSMLHEVTLGGTGKEDGDRHPKIEDGVLIGAGAKVLGNIRVGHCSRIAAGSVVLTDIPACKTVAGVPAKIVGEAGCDQPALSMDQLLRGPN